MRKNDIRRLANNQLMNDNRGSHRDKKYRHFVIHKMINDLFKLELLPGKWHGLTQTHIHALVTHWKKKKIKPTTLMKYLMVIRFFFKSIDHSIAGIDNQTLEVKRPKPAIKQAPSLNHVLQKISHPIARLIFQFQAAFGLTFSEVTRLIPDDHIREHSIWLTRDITFNHQDRVIPIRNDEQRHLLQSFASYVENHHSLITTHGYHAIRYIYSTSLQHAGFLSLKAYRYLYAQNQLPHLLKTFSSDEANTTLMLEMGLKSRTTLWSYLHEQDKA